MATSSTTDSFSFGADFGAAAAAFDASFGAPVEPVEQAAGDDDGGAANPEAEVPTAEYEPLVRLTEVAVVTGEEEETVVYKQRCKLYRFDPDTQEWKERGTGDVKLLQHKQKKHVRILLRQEKTFKLCMNHQVVPSIELAPNPGSDRSWTWATTDYAEQEPNLVTFAIKFKSAEIANAFKQKYDDCRSWVDGKLAALKADVEEKTDEDSKGSNAWLDVLKSKTVAPVAGDKVAQLFKKYEKKSGIAGSDLSKALSDVFDTVCETTAVEADLRTDIKKQMAHIAAAALKSLGKTEDSTITLAEFEKLPEVALALGKKK